MYAGFLAENAQITATSALALSLGIAIQNFPEGAIISMPLRQRAESKRKAFLGGVLSGVVEPIGAVMTILSHSWQSRHYHIYSALQQELCYMSWLKN